MCLISIDQWMITSLNDSIRGKSSPKIARNQIIIGLANFSIHVPIGFEIKNGRCFAYLDETYAIFFNVYNMMIIFLPIIIMNLFSIRVLVNIRQSRSSVEPSSPRANVVQQATIRTNRQMDMQFIRLAFEQVLVFIARYGIYNMYDLVTSLQMKTPDRRAIEVFNSELVVNLNYVSISVRLSKHSIHVDLMSILDYFFHLYFGIKYIPKRMCCELSTIVLRWFGY